MNKAIQYTLILIISLNLQNTYAGYLAKMKTSCTDYFESRKNVVKNIALAKESRVAITNKYGKIEILHSPGNELKIEVEIIVRSKVSIKEAEQIMNTVQINDYKILNDVKVITEFEKKGNENYKGLEEFKINYKVYLPVDKTLTINNYVGDIVLKKYTGLLNLNLELGNLYADNIESPGNINVKYGTTIIGDVTNGNFTFYSVDLNIGKLRGSARIKSELCEPSNITIGKETNSLQIEDKYSTIKIKSLAATGTYTFSTYYGSFTNNSKIALSEAMENYSKITYASESGKGNPVVEVTAKYSHITLFN